MRGPGVGLREKFILGGSDTMKEKCETKATTIKQCVRVMCKRTQAYLLE